MPEYIDPPDNTDPQDILQEAYAFLQSVIPGWTPAVGNLDVWLLMALATVAAESRDVASAVPKSIFRWFGANLVQLPPVDDTPARTTTTWTMIDTAGHTIPDGTQVSINSGDTRIPFVTQGAVIIPPGSSVATPITIVAITPGAAGSALGAPAAIINLEDPLDFVASVALIAATTGGVDAETDDAYLNRLVTELQTLAPRPILPADFAIFARKIAGVYRAVAIDGYNPNHNLLSANDASFETSIAGYTPTNAALLQSAAFAADGANSMRMTASSAADMLAVLLTANAPAVTPGDTITVVASYRSAVTVRSTKVGIRWLDGAGATISDVYGSGANDTTTGFTQDSVTAVAPALAAKAAAIVYVTAPANAEVHYVDKVSIRRGAGTDWVAGGTAETGNPRTVAVAGVGSDGTPIDAPTKAAVQADLQARREVNFIVNTLDPVVTSIDVTYTVKMLAGYDSATVVAAVNAAITAYLSPATWGSDADARDWLNQTTIRYLEVAAAINGALGVDYITTTAGNYDLQIARHSAALGRVDLTLAGAAPLPTAGTLAGTAV